MIYVFSVYGILSLITFCFYGVDKSAAKHGKQRIRESTLHLLSLFGGWFGALLGQKVFRHKTKKWHFLLVFWLTVVVNVTTMGYAVYFFQFS
ncbi:DUF1294 domain-containing protein [Marinomonas sp. UCMA 3892]|jgi:uncharacterized membrane protein YsdA (DUF1294 family)|uniref:DUF1294 domain-containing protein n=1 Tax=Marinomonas sp. (strain MWYL1) TaxID=400668 RepID=A6VVK5_MARMS|nr:MULTISPECIES: DUF1294 domain-containing protein [unclassified Marinomonas]NLU98309.1 DUF1294 domain-containing protein [Marinomonas sp. UCMA 3892]